MKLFRSLFARTAVVIGVAILVYGADSRGLRPVESRSPYLQALADALERRSGQEIEILASRDTGWLGRNSGRAGTGAHRLGLAIARQLAEANGWKVELRSRQGGGSEAVLSLPHDDRGLTGRSNGVGTAEPTARKVA